MKKGRRIAFYVFLRVAFVLAVSLIVSSAFAQQARVDVRLKDGTVLKGSIVSMDSTHYVIDTQFGRVTLQADQIESINFAGEARRVKVHLRDGSVITGTRIARDDSSLTLKTSVGVQRIPLHLITSIESGTGNASRPSTLSAQGQSVEAGRVGIGTALLYEQRRKKVGVALGMQMLGAGLLYAERYGLGALMMGLENGLIIGSFFVPDGGTGMLVAGTLLKAVDTYLTIRAVNQYNRRLLTEMGLIRPGPKAVRERRHFRGGFPLDVSASLSLTLVRGRTTSSYAWLRGRTEGTVRQLSFFLKEQRFGGYVLLGAMHRRREWEYRYDQWENPGNEVTLYGSDSALDPLGGLGFSPLWAWLVRPDVRVFVSLGEFPGSVCVAQVGLIARLVRRVTVGLHHNWAGYGSFADWSPNAAVYPPWTVSLGVDLFRKALSSKVQSDERG